MQAILFTVLVIGQMLVIRTQIKISERALISVTTLTKIGTAVLTFNFMIAFALGPTVATISILTISVLHWASLRLLELQKLRLIESLFPNFLDRWILNLRLGMSESYSRESALEEMDPHFAKLIRTLFLNGKTTHDHVLFDSMIKKELKNIATKPHSALNRLENLRSILKKSADFRRRSGQAIRQARIQAVGMVILLLAISFVALRRFGWNKVGDLIGLAVALSCCGGLAMNFLARKRKWKV